MSLSRIQFLDVAKGICILLVLIGHTPGVPYKVYKIIYSFHMPAFFFISGYLFNIKHTELGLIEFFKRGWERLIIPYFSMALICYVIFVIAPNLSNLISPANVNFGVFIKPIIGILYSRGNMQWLPNCTPLWFLTCLFLTELMFYAVVNISKNIFQIVLLSTICAFLGYLTSIFIPFKLPWNIDTALTATLFYCFGFVARKTKILESVAVWMLAIAILLSGAALKYNRVAIDMDNNIYGNIFWCYLGAISGIIILWWVSKWFERSKFLCFLGKNTMPIIGFSYAINSLTLKTLALIGIEGLWFINLLFIIGYIVLLLCLLSYFNSSHKLVKKLIYGKRNSNMIATDSAI